MRILTGVCALVVCCANAVAGEIDLSFNSDAVRAIYVHDFVNSDLSGDIGFLTNSDKGEVINASIFLQGFASDGVNPVQGTLGLRSGYVSGDDSGQDGIPFAIGGALRFTLPDYDRFSIRGEAWFAPDALSTGDIDKYQDFNIRLQYAFLREADVFVGARYVNVEFSNDSEQTFDNGMNAGFNIRF